MGLGRSCTASHLSWLKLVRKSGLDLDGAVAAARLDEFPDGSAGLRIAREIRWWRWFYRRLSSSSVTRVVIEVRGEPASTWAVIVTTASRGGETMQNWPWRPAMLNVPSPGPHQAPMP